MSASKSRSRHRPTRSVVEVDQFVGGEAQPLGDEPGGPFADAVERGAAPPGGS